MKLYYLQAATEELSQAIDYYNLQRPGLGDEFAEEVDRIAASIEQFPHANPPYEQNTRIGLTARFPYGLVYRIRNECAEVVAVMHLSRPPTYWRGRLRS